MIKSKIAYLFLLAAMFLFYIMFIDSMSLLTLIIAAVFPVIQLIILSCIARNITAALNIEKKTINKNTESRIIVKIKNHSVLPVSCAVATLQITNTLTGESQSLTTMLPVPSDNEQSIKFSVSYAHCGRVAVTLKSIKIYDYIKLFSKTITYGISQETVVIPSLASINPDVQTSLSTTNDCSEFSKVKPGDDSSEIFNIREYAYGDKINRIHWNLTTKLDELMVKEYSLPVSCSILIVFEFCSDRTSENRFFKNDAAIETAMSLSYFMIQNSISHQIAWYDAGTRLYNTETIKSEDDFAVFLGSIFNSGTYRDSFSAFIHHQAENSDTRFSHVIYISPVLSDEIFHNLSVLPNSLKKSYLYINDDSAVPDFFSSDEKTSAVNIICSDISGGLSKVII